MDARKDTKEQRALSQARVNVNLYNAPEIAYEGQPGFRFPIEAPDDMQVTMTSDMGPRKVQDAQVKRNKRGRVIRRIPAKFEPHSGRDYAAEDTVNVVAPGQFYTLFASKDASDVFDDNSGLAVGGLVPKYNPATGQIEEHIVLAAHLSAALVEEKEHLNPGDPVGLSGQSGRTSVDGRDTTTVVHMTEYRRKDLKDLLDRNDPIGDFLAMHETDPGLAYRRAIGRGNFPEDYEAVPFNVQGLEFRSNKAVPSSVRVSSPVSIADGTTVAPTPISREQAVSSGRDFGGTR